jgi:DNA-binding response OmpR family regulator
MALILMVDDEHDACQLMERILSALGHEVQAFTDGRKALEWLRGNVPELAILDIKLKGMSGLSVLESIRSNQVKTKVMMVTGYPSVESSNRAIELGVDDYMVKPIEIDELEQRVNRVLGLNS